MKTFVTCILLGFIGLISGILLSSILLKVFPIEACPGGDIYGIFVTYDCPKFHPSNWVLYLPFVGWILVPFVINTVYNKRFKRKLFETKKAFLILLSTAFVLVCIFFLMLAKISESF